jgi:hypothetical protein
MPMPMPMMMMMQQGGKETIVSDDRSSSEHICS